MPLPLIAAAALPVAQGIFGALGANKAAKANAANETAVLRYRRDTDQVGLTRRAKKLGTLLRILREDPKRYGASIGRIAELFGDVPGKETGYGASDFLLPQAPTIRGGGSSVLAGLAGGLGGLSQFASNADAARAGADAEAWNVAQRQTGGSGGGIMSGYNILPPGPRGSSQNVGGVDILPTRRLR